MSGRRGTAVRSSLREGCFAVALSVAAVTATIGVLEIVTRVLGLAPPVPPGYGEYEPHDVLPFRKKPNRIGFQGSPDGEFHYEFRTNAEGFRDVEHAREKPPGVVRILGLGDSYTEGEGAPFEETYLYRLERMLDATPGLAGRVEIIKAGQGRYWTEPERLLLETVGVQYRPDLVLIGFTPNDVTDTYIGWGWGGVRDGYLLTREAHELGPAGLWLYLHSHLGRLGLRPYVRWRLRSGTRGNQETMRFLEVFEPDGFHEPDWIAVEAELAKMIRIARSIDAVPVLVHIPTDVFQWTRATYPGERLSAVGRRHGVAVVDTLPALRAAATTEPMYWQRDIHCTPAGYRVIAETVYAALVDRELLP